MESNLWIIVGVLALLGAYCIGAIPFGLLIGKMRGIDVRTMGSKNIGATNVFRCVGAKFGILAFLLDMLKGFVGAWLPKALNAWLAFLPVDGTGVLLLSVLCGTAAMFGHIFPIYLGFKGGKGVSTALGLLFGVTPLAGALGLLGWIIVFLLSRYVSVASSVAACIVGGVMWTPLYAEKPLWFSILISVLAVLAILKHHQNFVRLINGTENRFAFTAKQRAARDAKLQQQEMSK